MIVRNKNEFVGAIRELDVKTPYVVVKPNWVSNKRGEYTEPEMLDWLLSALPQEKIIVESYIPWRGSSTFVTNQAHDDRATLEGGKIYWRDYIEQDEQFLRTTGIGEVIQKHKATYINVTNEYWSNGCVSSGSVKDLLDISGKTVYNQKLLSFIPKKLFDIRNDATFISLAKIKTETQIPAIYVSMSVKNLFGLLPDPSRRIYHGDNHAGVSGVVKDVYNLYTTVFNNSAWINEGIKTTLINYCDETQRVEENQGLLFIGRNGVETDRVTCDAIGVDPSLVPYLNNI